MAGVFRVEREYDRAMAGSGAAAAAGHYEVAYHLLMAALHCAEDAEDEGRLGAVASAARGLRDAVDGLTPMHALATRFTAGGRGVFEMAAATAEAVARRVEAARRVAGLRHRA